MHFLPAPIGRQIRELRQARGMSLEEVAHRAGTSAPALHRYESGWDRFTLPTLRRIARSLGASLEVRLIPGRRESSPELSDEDLCELLAPLFWDKPLVPIDLTQHPQWVIRRVLMFGDRREMSAVRRRFGEAVLREALCHTEVDERTRAYWRVILADDDAP